MPRETVRTTWNEVAIRKKFSPGASILFSTESEEKDWRKSLNSQKASPATKAENPLSKVGKMKKIVAWLSTSSRVSWLQVWKQMHSCLSLPISTCWIVRKKPSARSKRRKYPGISCYSEGKKSPMLCISKLRSVNYILRKVEELGLNASAGHTMKFSGCTWYKIEFGKEKGNLEALSEKVKLLREILARPVLRRNTWRNLTTSRLYQQSSMEFGEEICKLTAEDIHVLFSWKGARDTEDRMFDLWIRELNAQCWARRTKLRYNGYFEKSKNTISDLPRQGAVQINE